MKFDPLLVWLLVGVDELSSGLGAVGVAVDGDDLGVVDEAVDECGGNDIVGEDFAPVVPPESWRTPLCGFGLGDCGVLVVDRTHHPDRAVATLVIVEAVAPLQHDRLRLHDSMELVA